MKKHYALEMLTTMMTSVNSKKAIDMNTNERNRNMNVSHEFRYFVHADEMTVHMAGDRVEHTKTGEYELPDFASPDEAIDEAMEFATDHHNVVNDQENGIGSVTYWVIEVTRCIEDEDFGWLPCDTSGNTDDGHGCFPSDSVIKRIDGLEGSREEQAFKYAMDNYRAWLDYDEDCYTTVYGYMI